MKRTLVTSAAAAILALTGCGGDSTTDRLDDSDPQVDRAALRDSVMEALAQEGLVGGGECIDGVFSKYPDERLRAFAEEIDGSYRSTEAQAMVRDLMNCIALADGSGGG